MGQVRKCFGIKDPDVLVEGIWTPPKISSCHSCTITNNVDNTALTISDELMELRW